MDMREYETWKAEIEAEHTEAQRELTEATAAAATAQTARDVARAALLALRHKLAPFAAPLPQSLTQRAAEAAQAAHQSEGGLTLARQHVVNAKLKAERLADALAVVTQITAPAEAEEMAE
jgi:hypothetical protein